MIKGAIFRDAMISAAYNITNQRDAVNALNVFPVPDGDTGTNMSMTITSARKELERLPDDVTVDKVAKTTSSAMLRGARGNSGVILSLIFRGIAKGLKGKEEIDARDMILALSYGVESAYKAVMTPTEGTILTVVRLATQAGAQYGTEHKEAPFDEVFAHVIEGARDALAQTPELLPVLKKAGVVDAGGRGLLLIYMGYAAVLRGEEIEATVDTSEDGVANFEDDHDSLDEIKYAYCTEFIIQNLRDDCTDVLDIKDLQSGMILSGTVRNVIDFGAFVDIGIKQNGLIHVSQMGVKGLADPSKVLKLHQKVKVTVVSVDLDRSRIGLRLTK